MERGVWKEEEEKTRDRGEKEEEGRGEKEEEGRGKEQNKRKDESIEEK